MKRGRFSGILEIHLKQLAALLSMSKVVPINSGFSRSAFNPWLFATFNADCSDCSIKVISCGIAIPVKAIARAILEPAAAKLVKSTNENSRSVCSSFLLNIFENMFINLFNLSHGGVASIKSTLLSKIDSLANASKDNLRGDSDDNDVLGKLSWA